MPEVPKVQKVSAEKMDDRAPVSQEERATKEPKDRDGTGMPDQRVTGVHRVCEDRKDHPDSREILDSRAIRVNLDSQEPTEQQEKRELPERREIQVWLEQPDHREKAEREGRSERREKREILDPVDRSDKPLTKEDQRVSVDVRVRRENRAEKAKMAYPVTKVKRESPASDRSRDKRVYPDRLDQSEHKERRESVDLQEEPVHRAKKDFGDSREPKEQRGRLVNQSPGQTDHRVYRDFGV